VIRNGGGDVSIEDDTRTFLSLDELVEYFRCSRGRLATRLRRALNQATLPVTEMMARYCEMSYEIDGADVTLSGEILSCPSDAGSCQQQIYVGTYRNSVNVREQSHNNHNNNFRGASVSTGMAA